MSISTQNFSYFKNTAPEYGKSDYWRVDEEALVDLYFKKNGAKLLVLGCGGGRTLSKLHEKGFKITAIDIVPEMIEKAKERSKDLSIDFHVMDAAHLDFPEKTFDYVFFPFHGIDYVTPHAKSAIAEASRVLCDDGVFIFNSHNRFFIKNIFSLFKVYDDYEGVYTFRAWPWVSGYMKKYFHETKSIARISLLPWSKSNWKDRVYKCLPWLSKSVYFILSNPKK
jgi:ubiquinone/menaquinone biosynthesis C-methylase UbiE